MKSFLSLVIIGLFIAVPQAHSRDSKHFFSIQEAMNSELAKEKLDPDIRFYFGKQSFGAIKNSFGVHTSNTKTNAFNKSDEVACERAFLSAILKFQKRAQNEGGNAVVEIKSNYKHKVFSSETEYECHAGNVIAGTALKGKVVKLAN